MLLRYFGGLQNIAGERTSTIAVPLSIELMPVVRKLARKSTPRTAR